MWNRTQYRQPENDTIVEVKIDDEQSDRMHGKLRYRDQMWWTRDGKMYVYYVPTHWKPI